jgi:predicted nucleotidyltransferase
VKNLDELRASGAIIFEAISGSKAYGLDTPESDTDMRGVFFAPREAVYTGDVPPANQ